MIGFGTVGKRWEGRVPFAVQFKYTECTKLLKILPAGGKIGFISPASTIKFYNLQWKWQKYKEGLLPQEICNNAHNNQWLGLVPENSEVWSDRRGIWRGQTKYAVELQKKNSRHDPIIRSNFWKYVHISTKKKTKRCQNSPLCLFMFHRTQNFWKLEA
jgi:hypothetical protein